MPGETVPVATLEKLWRSLRRRASLADGEFRRSVGRENAMYASGMADAYDFSEVALRAIIDEAKGEK